MATQKPLVELMPRIIEHYNRYQDYLQFNLRVYNVLEGQIKKEVEDSLREEILSAAALRRALQRIPSLNILKKSTDKLSRVYMEKPLRLCDQDSDKNIIKTLSTEMHLDSVMTDANRIYNSQHIFALEPYINDGKHSIRVLAGHQFLPFSDDPVNPLNMTVFIKLMGSEYKKYALPVDDKGYKKSEEEQIRLVDILWLYSDNEFLIVDSSGSVRYDKMKELGLSDVNPFGRIPFIVGSKSKFELVPFPNQSGFDISILIPKLLTDLNYASQFMSHSIIWTKNTDISGNEINPDSIVHLGDKTAENGDPDIGVINPVVDITNTLKLIEYELTSYLSTIGIKSAMDAGAEAGAGVAKAIDEGDITAEYKTQTEYFKQIEHNLWELLAKMHSVWVKSGEILSGERKLLSQDFIKSFRIQFQEIKTLKTHQQILDEIKVARELKLMSRRQALRELKPELTEDQITSILEEIRLESEEEIEHMLENGFMGESDPTVPQGRTSDGTFQNGNQFGKQQEPEKNLKARIDG